MECFCFKALLVKVNYVCNLFYLNSVTVLNEYAFNDGGNVGIDCERL